MRMFTKKDAERGVAHSLLAAVNAVQHQMYVIASEGEAPDFTCQSESGEPLGIEVTAVYYGAQSAKAAWGSLSEFVRVFNPDQTIADGVEEAIRKKAQIDYGTNCALAIHLDAPLTTTDDFEDDILPSIEVTPNKFASIFCRLKATAEKPYGLVWWQIYPKRARYYREPRLGGADAEAS